MADNNNQQQLGQYQQAGEQQQGGTGTYEGASGSVVPPRAEGYRTAAIRESRIKDRPYKTVGESVKIKIELDLEVEVDLYAKVKGDVTIGLL